MLRIISYTIRGAMLGALLAFLNGGSSLVCFQTFSGEKAPGWNIFSNIFYSHLAYCIGQKGLPGLVVIILASFVPFAWIVAFTTGIVVVPQFAIAGAGLGLLLTIVAVIQSGQGGSRSEFNSSTSGFESEEYKTSPEPLTPPPKVEFVPVSPSPQANEEAELLTRAFNEMLEEHEIDPAQILTPGMTGKEIFDRVGEAMLERMAENQVAEVEATQVSQVQPPTNSELLKYQRQAIQTFLRAVEQREAIGRQMVQARTAERDVLARLTENKLSQFYDSQPFTPSETDADGNSLDLFLNYTNQVTQGARQAQEAIDTLRQWRAARRRRQQLIGAITAITPILLIVLCITAFFGFRSWQINRRQSAANEALAQGQWEKAREEALAWMSWDENSAEGATLLRESYYQAAEAALKAGQWDTARTELQELSQFDENYRDTKNLIRETYYRPATIALEVGQWDKARQLLKQLLDLDSEYKDTPILYREVYYQAASSALRHQDWEEARSELQALLALDSEYKDAPVLLRESYYQQAVALAKQKAWDEAAQAVFKLKALDPYYKDIAQVMAGWPHLQQAVAARYSDQWIKQKVTLKQLLKDHLNKVAKLTFSVAGTTLASGFDDGQIQFWKVTDKDWQAVNIWQGHEGRINALTFSPNDQFLVSGSLDQTVQWWEVSKCISEEALCPSSMTNSQKENWGAVSSLSFSPDAVFVAIAASDRVWVWKLAEVTWRDLAGHSGRVNTVAISSDSTLLASGGEDKVIKLWQISSGSPVRTMQGHNAGVSSVDFSADGKLLVSGSWDNVVRVWQVADGKLIHTLEGHTASVNSVDFSPDGALIASGALDGTINLWRVADGKLVHTLRGHGDSVNALSFAPDGSLLASASDDKTIRLWYVKP